METWSELKAMGATQEEAEIAVESQVVFNENMKVETMDTIRALMTYMRTNIWL
jgi:hypothetical protein